MKKVSNDAVREVFNQNDLDNILKTTTDSLIIGVFSSATDLKESFYNIAETLSEKYTFVATSKDLVADYSKDIEYSFYLNLVVVLA